MLTPKQIEIANIRVLLVNAGIPHSTGGAGVAIVSELK